MPLNRIVLAFAVLAACATNPATVVSESLTLWLQPSTFRP